MVVVKTKIVIIEGVDEVGTFVNALVESEKWLEEYGGGDELRVSVGELLGDELVGLFD